MIPQHRSATYLLVAALLAAGSACSEPTTPTAAPVGANTVLAAAPNANTKVKVKQLQLSANTLRIDGPAVTAQVSIGNSGTAFTGGISLRGEITQGAASRQAANLPTQCNPGDDPGFLPGGTCNMTFDAQASNAAPGSGTLVPGPATLILHVIQTVGTTESELASKSIDVNLVATPGITALALAPTTLAIDGPAASYTATLQNPANSLQGVLLQGYIVQGQSRRAAGGSLVTCGSNAGVLPPGTCTMTLPASASNTASGNGTLVPGPATFELDLIQTIGGGNTTLDAETVAITLVSSTPTIASLELESLSIVIDGPSDDYTAQLQNPGFPVTDVLLQGELVQEQGGTTITVGAGGTSIDCGDGLGVLPTTGTETCTIHFTATASTTAGGNGTLVPGPAQFVLHLYKAPPDVDPTEFDSRTVAVTLTSPAPTITSIVPGSTFVVLDQPGTYTEYTAIIDNPGTTRSGILLQGWVSQGTARRAAGGGFVTCIPTSIGTLPNGSCSFASVIDANNTTSQGTGTLVPGPATFELELKQNDGTTETILDTKSIPITLVANTPSIVSIALASTSIPVGGSTTYTATLYNPTGSTITNVYLQGYLDQGTIQGFGTGGTQLTCTGLNAELPPGSCVITWSLATKTSSDPSPFGVGEATFRLQMFRSASGVDTVLDEKSVTVNLTSP